MPKITLEEDFFDNGYFHVTPELEIGISRFGKNKNKLHTIRLSWLIWNLWFEFTKT